MEPNNDNMNPGLYRLHRLFFTGFMSFAVIMVLMGIRFAVTGGEDAAIGFIGIAILPVAAAHWYAAKGAKNGKASGKILSRVIGTLWLLGFPIGTALGIYVWHQTTKKWSSAADNENQIA